MLDQNTDRMWYVIGAVIVGAAIIFLMNTSFPQLFASVGDTFKDKTDEVMVSIGEMNPNTRINLYTNGNYSYSGMAEGLPGVGTTIGGDIGSLLQVNIPVKANTTYQLSYKKNRLSDGVVVLTQAGTVPSDIAGHNTIYLRPERRIQYHSVQFKDEQVENVTFRFTTKADETHVSLTSGNFGVVDRPFGAFSVKFTDVELMLAP